MSLPCGINGARSVKVLLKCNDSVSLLVRLSVHFIYLLFSTRLPPVTSISCMSDF